MFNFVALKVRGCRISRDSAELTVIGMIIGFTIFFSYYSWLQYSTFRYAHDFASALQSLWGLTHGMSGPELKLPLASPILYILAVPYYFYPHAWTILVLQNAVLALGALPLFWIAKDELKSKIAGVILAAAYLLYPAVGNQNYAQWHTQSFIPLLLFLSFYFYKSRRWKPYVTCIVLLLLTQVFVPIVLLFLALYQLLTALLVWTKAKRTTQANPPQRETAIKLKNLLFWPLITFVAIIGYSIISYTIMSFVPNFLGLASKSLGRDVPYEEYPSLIGLVLFYLTHPSILISAIQGDWLNKFQYLIQLFSPVAYISLFDPSTLFLSLPWIGAGFLTSTYGAYYYSIYNQNICYVFPFVFISAVYGIKRLSSIKFLSKSVSSTVDIGKVLAVVILISTLISALSYSVISPMNVQQNNPQAPGGWQQVNQHHLTVMKIISLVPPEASICVDDVIASNEQIAQRQSYFLLGRDITTFPEYVLLDFGNPFRLSSGETQFPYLPGKPMLKELLANNYGIYASEDGVALWKYGYSGQPIYYMPLKRVYGPNDMVLNTGEKVSSSDALFQQVIATPTTVSSSHWFLGPSYLSSGQRKSYAVLPAGDYEVTFRLRLLNATTMTGAANDTILQLRLVQSYGAEVVETPGKSSRLLYAHDFSSSAWQNFTMRFTLAMPTWGVGFQLNNPKVAMECEYVALTQLSSAPNPLPTMIGGEETLYRPAAFIYGNLTKDIATGQAIFQSAPIGNESSLLPFHFVDGQIVMPISNIQFSENLLNISETPEIFVDSHLNASFQELSRNGMPYLNLIISNKTAVSINSPYSAVFRNKMDVTLSMNSSVFFGFNSPSAEGIFSSYFPKLVLYIVDSDNSTHEIHIQYGFYPPGLSGLQNIYYYVHPTAKLDSTMGFGQIRIGDIISSVNQSWIPYRLTKMDYQGTLITTETLAKSYSVSFNFYAATITESPVTVNAKLANDTLLQTVPLNGVECALNVNEETEPDMKLSVSGLDASLMNNVRIPFYYSVNASVNELSDLEQQYSWDLSLPEGPNYAVNIIFALNGLNPTDIKNLTLNDISMEAAIEGWSSTTAKNLSDTITVGSKLHLLALVYRNTLTPETYYVGNPTITYIPFQDMNVIMGISLVPVLIAGVWYMACKSQNRKFLYKLLNRVRSHLNRSRDT